MAGGYTPTWLLWLLGFNYMYLCVRTSPIECKRVGKYLEQSHNVRLEMGSSVDDNHALCMLTCMVYIPSVFVFVCRCVLHYKCR